MDTLDRLDIHTQQMLRQATYALARYMGIEIVEEFWDGSALYALIWRGELLTEGNLYAVAGKVYRLALRLWQPEPYTRALLAQAT